MNETRVAELKEELEHQLAVIRQYSERTSIDCDRARGDANIMLDVLATIECAAYRARMLVGQISTYPGARLY